MQSISLAQARSIAINSQGLGNATRRAKPQALVSERKAILEVFSKINVIQVDSVNVLTRSEQLVLFARLGNYRRSTLRELDESGELYEYWAHEASLILAKDEHLFGWRQNGALGATDKSVWSGVARFHIDQRELVESVYKEIAARGPIAPSELTPRGTKEGNGWGWHWDDTKRAVENLFWTGRICAAYRGPNFERHYDIRERCAQVSSRETLDDDQARKTLILKAVKAMGVASVSSLIDYHRHPKTTTKILINELVESGELVEVEIDGLVQKGPCQKSGGQKSGGQKWLASPNIFDTKSSKALTKAPSSRCLLSPFDSLIWDRQRTQELFAMRYRVEIYVPKPKREFGYYVLPFLLGNELVARIDLKADRANSTLLVQSAHGEPLIEVKEVVSELAQELKLMALWLGLESVKVVGSRALVGDLVGHFVGDLAKPLERTLR